MSKSDVFHRHRCHDVTRLPAAKQPRHLQYRRLQLAQKVDTVQSAQSPCLKTGEIVKQRQVKPVEEKQQYRLRCCRNGMHIGNWHV